MKGKLYYVPVIESDSDDDWNNKQHRMVIGEETHYNWALEIELKNLL